MYLDIQSRVKKIIGEITNQNEHEIHPDHSLRDDYEFDSLKQMTLFITLEDEFELTIPPEQTEGIETVKEVIDFIYLRMKSYTRNKNDGEIK